MCAFPVTPIVTQTYPKCVECILHFITRMVNKMCNQGLRFRKMSPCCYDTKDFLNWNFFFYCKCVDREEYKFDDTLFDSCCAAHSATHHCSCHVISDVNRVERAPNVFCENSVNLLLSERSPGVLGPNVRICSS